MSFANFSDAVFALHNGLARLSARDRSFALSLLDQWNQRGSLSAKQSHWVEELARRARAQTTTPTAAPVAAVRAVTFPKIIELFAHAGNRAAIVFQTASGEKFRLSVAGERAAYPGAINVTDAERSFESRTWFGRIMTSGAWQPKRDVETRAVEAALEAFNADPDKASAEFGRSTGICCFCGRELTDERSVSVGRGPICSDRFGLPWGETQPKAELRAEAVNEAQIPF
jgi:hypothetical protein